ncbi:P-loop ATPase, Sll1717 family, partial [Coraliomargarita parva]|uniref:P-loop ATPase, Sll1717 family n=1 Tax=Coraliomargarita parva TaxID=3014050 RepID=UPI0022B2C76C
RRQLPTTNNNIQQPSSLDFHPKLHWTTSKQSLQPVQGSGPLHISGSEKEQISFSETRFQQNLRYIQMKFESALGQLKLQKNHLVFIDGIDIRPPDIGHKHYLDCIKGLANAVWSINQDIFSQFRDTKGRMRIVLLVRPDIFDSLGLQNQNTKLRDNSILLDWRTSYAEHRSSTIFEAADRILGDDQGEKLNDGDAWDYYFPYNASNVNTEMKNLTSFIGFLRYSLHRPRDIITMLSLLQEDAIDKGRHNKHFIEDADFNHPDFRSKYALYLLGEVKDQILFYYRPDEYELFLRFFEYLGGRPKFNYEEFILAYENIRIYVRKSKKRSPFFLRTAQDFLQFLYTLNIISFKEEAEDGQKYIRWCFRERSYSNISPKVRTDSEYEIHYGLKSALNLGKPIKTKPTRR